jgi:exopolysaccharide biosynthesis WecB/TagA/CpsF family protein
LFGNEIIGKLIITLPGFTMKKVKILNLDIDNFSKAEFLEKLQSGVVFTPNVDHLMKLRKDADFFKAYSVSDYKICDSQLLVYAAKFLGTPIQEKISGSDFFPDFYNYHQKNPAINIFLLGAGDGVAHQAQIYINNKVGRNIIVGTYSPPFGFEKDETECLHILKRIQSSGATVVVVGFGAPKQEKWIHKYKDSLPQIKIFMALGATIDFEAGKVQRAPKWMSKIGFEWLFRLLSEPKRLWKRYLVDDIPFLLLILKQKLKFNVVKKHD